MIQQIAYNLYLKDCKKIHKHVMSKKEFLFDSTLYVHKYHDKALKVYRVKKLKYLLDV